MDAGERPWDTALRECQEETGLSPAGPLRLLAVVFGLPGTGWPYPTIGCVFDGGRVPSRRLVAVAFGLR